MLYNFYMKFIKKIICVLLILCLTGCSSITNTIATTHVYTVYPIGYLLNRIGGDRIQTATIQNNANVANATILSDYDEIMSKALCFYHIEGLEPYMDLYEDEINNYPSADLDLSNSSIYSFKRYTPVTISGNTTFIENNYYEGAQFDDIDGYTNDLFLWLNPIGMLSMAKDIYNYLSSNYAEQASYFEDNYLTLENDLITLDAAFQTLSSNLVKNNQEIKFVSMTPSFGSWQKAYGIQVYPVCLSKYGALPTDSQLEIIKQRIKEDNVQYIVYEPNMSDEMAALFSELESELSLKRVNLSNISSLTESQQTDNKDYLTIMYENLSVLENIATSKSVSSEETSETSNLTPEELREQESNDSSGN